MEPVDPEEGSRVHTAPTPIPLVYPLHTPCIPNSQPPHNPYLTPVYPVYPIYTPYITPMCPLYTYRRRLASKPASGSGTPRVCS